MWLSLLYSIFILSLHYTAGAKILAIFPYPGPSQYIMVQPYLKTLAERGHELTVINTFPQKTPMPNFRDIPVEDIHDTYNEIVQIGMRIDNLWTGLNFWMDFVNNVTLNTLQNYKVQQLLNSGEQFDLIITETLRTDALYGFGQHFNAPLIGVSAHGTDWHVDELMGNTSPPSYNPLITTDFTDRMTFVERLKNLILVTINIWFYKLKMLPIQNRYYRQYFPNANMTFTEVRKSFVLMLLNQHFSLSFPRPYVPNMIQVAGLHISQTPRSLPADILDFIRGAKDGVIYFSLGSNIRSKDLPVETRDVLLKVFGGLKQRVLWKFEDNQLPGKPSNVFIQTWFPQPDVLAHPNVKLFITHGGLLSTIEAIHHGKPVLGLPVFYDQFLNIERAKQAGYGLSVDFFNLKETDLIDAIYKLLNYAHFGKNAADRSQRYHDQPMSPLDTAIWWTEYVLRHKGAPHMRVAAMDLNFVQHHCLDTGLFILFAIALSFSLFIYIIFKITKLLVFENNTNFKVNINKNI